MAVGWGRARTHRAAARPSFPRALLTTMRAQVAEPVQTQHLSRALADGVGPFARGMHGGSGRAQRAENQVFFGGVDLLHEAVVERLRGGKFLSPEWRCHDHTVPFEYSGCVE